jgi:hypothetical protein
MTYVTEIFSGYLSWFGEIALMMEAVWVCET